MATADELRALAARVMALTGADKALDCEIAQAVGARPVSWAQGGDKYWVNWPAYTESLDLAVSLVSEDGFGSIVAGRFPSGEIGFVAVVTRPAHAEAEAATPALALTAAALMARAEAMQ